MSQQAIIHLAVKMIGHVCTADDLEAFEAAVRHEHGERIAVEADELCPHEADSHAEGTCELCDYAFAVGELARDLSADPS